MPQCVFLRLSLDVSGREAFLCFGLSLLPLAPRGVPLLFLSPLILCLSTASRLSPLVSAGSAAPRAPPAMHHLEHLDMSEPPPWLPAYRVQGTHMEFASEAEALTARIMDWGELNGVLRSTCQSPPAWGGATCGRHRGCTYCKLTMDDVMINPLSRPAAVLAALSKGLRQFDRAAQAHGLLQTTLVETAREVLTSTESIMPSRELFELIKGWGFIALHSREAHELLRTYRIPLECLIYRTVMPSIAGQVTLRYQILYDPGSPRVRWLPTSACALGCLNRLTQPSRAKAVSAHLELLMGVYCLSFHFPATLAYTQNYMAALGPDLTKTIMASIRSVPVIPSIQWDRWTMEPGEAGLLHSPRLAPLPSPPLATLTLGRGGLPLSGSGHSVEVSPAATRSVS